MLLVKRFSAVLSAAFVVAALGTATGLFIRQTAATPAVAQSPTDATKKPAPPAVSIKIVTDDAGAIRNLVVTEDGDDATLTTPRALGRYLKRLHRDAPAASITVQVGGKIGADVLPTVSGVCRDAGFARFAVKATDATFELVDERKDLMRFLGTELLSQAQPADKQDKVLRSAVEWLKAHGDPKPLNAASTTYHGLAALALSQAQSARSEAVIQQLFDATKAESKIEGVWKVTGVKVAGKDLTNTPLNDWVWIIAGDQLITISADKPHIGAVSVDQKGGAKAITVTFVRNQPGTTLRGTFTVDRNGLAVTFPEGFQSGAAKSELAITFRREAWK